MTTAERAIGILAQLQTFFTLHNVGAWAQRSAQAIDELGKAGADTEKILWKYTGRGMGSIADLYISADNGHTIPTTEQEANKQLEELTTQLFNIQLGVDSKKQPTNTAKLLKRISTIVCIMLVVGGDLIYYFNAYRYQEGRTTLGMLMMIFGSMVLFIMYLGNWIDGLNADYKVYKRRWLPASYKKPLAYILYMLFILLHLEGLPKFATERQNRILQNEETQETTATVTGLKVKKGFRSSTKHLAIIQYQTASGIITQSIDDECNCHYTGQPIRIVYAVDYPEMFYGIISASKPTHHFLP